jgi:hypothetical protein
VALDPAGPLAEAAWAKQRVSRATQGLPNGFCALPLQKACPHANAPLAELTSIAGRAAATTVESISEKPDHTHRN